MHFSRYYSYRSIHYLRLIKSLILFRLALQPLDIRHFGNNLLSVESVPHHEVELKKVLLLTINPYLDVVVVYNFLDILFTLVLSPAEEFSLGVWTFSSRVLGLESDLESESDELPLGVSLRIWLVSVGFL